jgi:hypothetical protein
MEEGRKTKTHIPNIIIGDFLPADWDGLDWFTGE